jgi:hypothetical protein
MIYFLALLPHVMKQDLCRLFCDAKMFKKPW